MSTNKNYQKNLDYLKESLRVANLQLELVNEILEFSKVCNNIIENGGKILFCGNGGSASDSQHLAAEIVVRFRHNRKPLPALALTTDTSVITSISNDFSFDEVFSRQLEAIATEKDILIAISTSGESKNIINALKKAKELGMLTLCLTGNSTKNVEKLSDYLISIPSEVTGVVQQSHITIGQLIAMNIEDNFLDEK
tara:strand:+ start:8742 stop:9329 length:588 start_codon:yes stop_codon:yes gene_type:complete